MWWWLGLAALLPMGFLFCDSLLAADLKPSSRIAIIRAFTAEYATVKSALPRGEKGLWLQAQGEIDQKNLNDEIVKNGTAIAPHVLVQITGIEFKDKEIVFEINGGGKRKSKWYEHIEVGIGYGTTPISRPGTATTPTGSYITLAFSKGVPDLSVEQLKEHLRPVLDFNPTTPIQALSRPVPPEFQEAIEAGQVKEGMDRDMVLAALGPPDRKVREMKEGVEQEDWIYGTPPLKVIFVTFEGDEVVRVREYRGGVTGTVNQPYSEEPPR